MFQEWINKYNEIINKGENMEEDIREAIERLNLAQNDIGYATLYSQEEQDRDIQILIKEYRELDEMTAVKYLSIQRDAYFRGRAEEQQRAEQIIYENYIPKSKIKEKIEELKLPNIIVGGRRNYKVLEYGKKIGKLEILQELLEE